MPSANVFDDCLFKGEEKLRKGKRGEEKNLILILFLFLILKKFCIEHPIVNMLSVQEVSMK